MARVKEKLEWFEVLAPEIFESKVIGTVPVKDEPKKMIGKTVEADLFTLTGDASKYYMNFKFKIHEFSGNKFKTKLMKHECLRDFIARMVRPRTSKIYTNDIFEFKDGKIRIKTIAISNRVVTENVKKKIRQTIREMLEDYAKKTSVDDFFKLLISNKIQETIRKTANKVYPLRRFEIVKTHVLES